MLVRVATLCPVGAVGGSLEETKGARFLLSSKIGTNSTEKLLSEIRKYLHKSSSAQQSS